MAETDGSFDLATIVNGREIRAAVAPDTTLVAFLRESLRLTGTHVGCDTSQCGACVVHLDGRSVKSCTVLAVQAHERTVTTIEGIGSAEALSPVQRAFRTHHALQCGFCTPGIVMGMHDLLAHAKAPTRADIIDWLDGHICRCTGYQPIIAAVEAAAEEVGR